MVLFKKKIRQNGFKKHVPAGWVWYGFVLLFVVQEVYGDGEVQINNGTMRDVSSRVRMSRQVKPPFLNQVCGGALAVDPRNTTYILSPMSGTTKVQCRWNIQVPFGKQIKFVFEYFDLASTRPDCSDLYFDIKDVTGTQRYCHEGPTERSYTASGSVLEVTYYSQESRQEDGGLRLRLEYGNVPCQAFFNNVARGSMFTPGYPNFYPDNRTCTWRVQVPVGYLLQLSCDPTSFWIENAPNCQNDILLLSLTGRVDFADGVRFCGRRGPNGLVSYSNVITMLFKSNLYYHYRGFHCEFVAIPAGGITPTIPPTVIPPDPNSCGSCGVANQPTVRVTGGTESVKNQFPWTVAILRRDVNSTVSRQFCGGTILNDRYVLTAAHCVNQRTADVLRVDVGDHNLSDATETRSRIFRVSSLLVHPAYQSNPNNNVDNDIAILKLDQSLNFSQLARPACLPTAGALLDGMAAVVAGWGKTSSTAPSSTVLRIGNVQVLPLSNCVNSYGQTITNNMVCAGTPPGTPGAIIDACPGDSGGPLTVFLGGRWYLIGVVSSGPPNEQCGLPNVPGIYTRVGNYIPWISDNTRVDSTCSVQRNFNSDAQTEVAALAASASSSSAQNDSPETAKPANRPALGTIVAFVDDNSSGKPSGSLNFPFELSFIRPYVPVKDSTIPSGSAGTLTHPFSRPNRLPPFLQSRPSSGAGHGQHKPNMHDGTKYTPNRLPPFLTHSHKTPSGSAANTPINVFTGGSAASAVPASGNRFLWKPKRNRYQEILLN